ncbi:MAG: hypothetical protein H6736_13955 [Alphaproteobacteria bacterium]|nr:hypothetical protein [Alphaproteobacteria bacterium]MCB9692911.1 hypothetical protein [Alphaproteobacteria bacterium]
MRSRLPLLAAVLVLALGPVDALAQSSVSGFLSPGDLARVHEPNENNCFTCHAINGQGVDPNLCMNCHETVRQQVRQGLGFHSDKGRNCESCHKDHRGRSFNLIPRGFEADFDHDKTGFPLNGAHRKATCEDCHTTPGQYTGLRSTCESCHDEPHGAEKSKRDLLASCDQCHNETEWKALPIAPEVFDHTSGTQTDYVLTGAHLEVFCGDCHFDWRFVPVRHDQCIDCHQDPHRADFGKDTCEDCHGSPGSWKVQKFNHNRTGYPLEGLHAEVDCHACHKGNATTPLPHDTCENCHEDMHSGQFRPRQCEDCHTVDVAGFALRSYDHDTTSFPLVGLHAGVNCEDCHGDRETAVYLGRPFDDCDACHVDEHQGRFEPTMCQRCHTAEGFRALFFNHDDTNFPHTGKHKQVACNGCHEDFRWVGFPYGSCADCHEKASPHQPGVLGSDTCDDCHNTESFKQISFDHAANTRFDLGLPHGDKACGACHEGIDRFEGLTGECTACHQEERPWGHYDGQCGTCHEAAHWFPGGLGDQEHSVTGFALRGAHTVLDCEECHMPDRARGEAKPQCIGCHRQDDSHRNQLGNVCDDCHTEMSWFRVRWRHGTTGWPLRGAHKMAECVDCHPSSYTGTPTQCFRCHAYEASASPYHQSGLLQSCDTCHRVYGWLPVRGAEVLQ